MTLHRPKSAKCVSVEIPTSEWSESFSQRAQVSKTPKWEKVCFLHHHKGYNQTETTNLDYSKRRFYRCVAYFCWHPIFTCFWKMEVKKSLNKNRPLTGEFSSPQAFYSFFSDRKTLQRSCRKLIFCRFVLEVQSSCTYIKFGSKKEYRVIKTFPPYL